MSSVNSEREHFPVFLTPSSRFPPLIPRSSPAPVPLASFLAGVTVSFMECVWFCFLVYFFSPRDPLDYMLSEDKGQVSVCSPLRTWHIRVR